MGGPLVIIKTTRFGQVQFEESDLLTFSEGILGFADLTKFVILDDPNDEIFAWLQSCEAPAIAFPVLEPELFAENYNVNLAKTDYLALNMSDMSRARMFSIVTIPDDPTLMTANLKAPVVVNLDSKAARQCVLQDNHLAIREPIFTKLQHRVVTNPEQSIKSQSHLDVAVKINNKAPEAQA
jgi:flagellar assembly factor FliW